MPLTELMNYFNDQLQAQARVKSLPRTGFYKVGNSYWARFGNLTLGTDFHAIRSTHAESTIGYDAKLLVRASTGNLLNIDSIFNSLDSHDQIVHLDRLVRTLHSLNYLQQFDEQDHLLCLQVQPRHIVSVTEDHGKTFEAILADCGLKPERVLLHTRLLDQQSLAHFYKALTNYRARGYKIGISLAEAKDLTLLANLGLTPEFVFVQHSAFDWLGASTALKTEQAHLAPVEFYDAKRILVTPNNLLNEIDSQQFSGVLVVPEEHFDDVDFVQKAQAY